MRKRWREIYRDRERKNNRYRERIKEKEINRIWTER